VAPSSCSAPRHRKQLTGRRRRRLRRGRFDERKRHGPAVIILLARHRPKPAFGRARALGPSIIRTFDRGRCLTGRRPPLHSDETLFQRVRAGDIAAFDALYERYELRIFAYLRAFTGSRQDAEELLHDAFLAALKTEHAPLAEGAFRGLLYRVARNLASNRRRSARRHARLLASAPEAAPAPAGADVAIERRELQIALEDAVGRLPDSLGELYHLRSSGLSYEQIATVVEAPLGTVKSRMHQMVNVLREELKPWVAPK